ncbi:MAG TPA: LytR C-terminal domain-containing protein [Sporichthyaceae bacterium]|nr:LytR C-terminal domain-containing protein [Sporichthyaceae bacterium]
MSPLRPSAGGSVPRFRPVNRRKRFLAVCLVLIVLGAVGAGSAYLVKGGGLRKGSCQRVAYFPPSPLHAPVNVFNSTTQGGLAGQVKDQLQQRGFTIGTVGNDPYRRKIRGTGELRYDADNSDGLAQVNALRPWNLGMAPVPDPQHPKGPSVDFVIGDSFGGLYPTAKPLPGQVLPCVATTAPAAN